MTHTHLVPRLKPPFTGPARGRRGDTCLEGHKKTPHSCRETEALEAAKQPRKLCGELCVSPAQRPGCWSRVL